MSVMVPFSKSGSDPAVRPALPLSSLLAFAILSVGDLAFTRLLVVDLNQAGLPDKRFFENNPLAFAWYERFGWHGLMFYKVAALAVFAISAIVIAQAQPRKARFLANFGCLVVGIVLLYSFYVLRRETMP